MSINGTSAYLSIAEHLEHVCVERFNSLVVAGEDLLLDGAQVQRVRHLLIVLAVPDGTQKHSRVNLCKCGFVHTKKASKTKT